MPASARLIDLSRLVSRLCRGPLTGVDRVEAAYLSRFLDDPVPLFALVRTAVGYLLLDRSGAQAVRDWAAGAPLPAASPLARLARRGDPRRAAAEAAARSVARARCLPLGLAAMLRRDLPAGLSYVNVGHANLSARVMRAVHAVPGARIAVLVHDLIPLDHPRFSRPGVPRVFVRKMRRVSAHADLVICNSARTRDRAAHHFAAMGRVPPMVVAHLGIALARPDPAALPPGLDLSRPYFVTLGTIEPRKNHAMLLDVWDRLAASRPPAEVPTLCLAGGRGWSNAAVFDRLDRMPPEGGVVELPGLDDCAVAALLAGARALLFPSLDEGFGLPALEAAALGVPVVCSDLPVFHELLADCPVYLDPADSYAWQRTIEAMTRATGGNRDGATTAGDGPRIPTWEDHFNTVLALI